MSTKKGRLGPRRHGHERERALVLGHAVVETHAALLDLRVPVQVQADAAAPRAVRQRQGEADAAVASSPALLALLDESRIYDQWVARFCSCAT